jgi:tRNA dimethylallyltransferase
MTEGPGGPLLVLGGVTAAGKTAAGVELALRHGGELVGADSIQVYRGFDIGSAKPTAAELRGVPHHLLDVADPDDPLDAMRFARLADAAIADVRRRGRVPIVVGGTGLWLRALLRGLVELPPSDPAIRARLTEEAQRSGAEALHARLRGVDPRAAGRIHPRDAVRIVRALEVHAQTGVPLGELQEAHALGAPRYDALLVALDRPRESLYPTIRARLDAMVEAGWIEEIRRLVVRWGADIKPLRSVGYRQLLPHVTEGVSLEEALLRAYKATRVYTRRQRTWFRGEPGQWWEATADALLGDEGRARLAGFL